MAVALWQVLQVCWMTGFTMVSKPSLCARARSIAAKARTPQPIHNASERLNCFCILESPLLAVIAPVPIANFCAPTDGQR
jgi:hypothetical protein